MPQGYALTIGLNSVDPGHYAGWDGPLLACEADAEDMEGIAKIQGFQVKKLLTQEATRDKVLAEIKNATQVLKKGDLFICTYSGHGGQVPDKNSEEADGQDETWCLYDGQLLDDELYLAMSQLDEGVHVFMLSDSCHSGSMNRTAYAALHTAGSLEMLMDTLPQGTEPPPQRFRAMPLPLALRTYRNNKGMYDAIMGRLPKGDPRSEMKATVLLISGCQDNQLSSDGAFNGLFTAQLLRVWNGGKFRGGYRTFHQRISRRMPPLQSPNYSFVGTPDPEFEHQVPFHIH